MRFARYRHGLGLLKVCNHLENKMELRCKSSGYSLKFVLRVVAMRVMLVKKTIAVPQKIGQGYT